jgi:hypothetical protein
MAGLKLHGCSWELAVEGKEKGEKEGSSGARPGGALQGGSAWACGLLFVSCSLRALPLLCVLWLAVREGEEKEEERRGKEKKREKNMEIFSNLKIFKK